MDIIKAASNWAKAEVVSARFFMLFGLVYLSAGIALWQLAHTSILIALIIPILIAGGLLLMAGIGFYISNTSMLKTFESEYKANPSAFIQSEIERTENTMKTYQKVALKVFPAIVVVALLVFIFISNPTIKAISIAIVAFFAPLILLDSQALKRMRTYHQHLALRDKELKT